MNRLPHILVMLLLLGLMACDQAETTYMVGTLERDRIELKVESSEPIIAIHVRDGQAVRSGEPVVDQDPERATARLAQQTGLLKQAAARLAELERGPREESIHEARAGLELENAQLENARANLKRTREVFAQGLSSQGQLDRDETLYKTAVAQVKASREALDRLLHGTTIEELQQAAAAVEAAEATVRQAQLDLDRTRIQAPVDGVIDKILFRLGERPPQGKTIAVLLDSSRTFARVYVPEHLRAKIVPGKTVGVRVNGVEKVFTGRVSWVSSDASFTPYFALTEHDRSRLSYLAEIDVPEASGLPSGIPLEVDFPGK